MTTRNSKTAPQRARKAANKVDVKAILTKPVKVGKQGHEQRMTPFEVSLRALVKQALKEQRLSAIRSLLDIALKYELVVPAPDPPLSGGVVIWPSFFDFKSKEEFDAALSESDKYSACDKRKQT